jgi:outer membrane receptor for ferrienterochelin and colicin
MKKIILLNASLLFLLGAQHLIAEEIKIPIGAQTQELQDMNRPKTGMTKTAVKQQFGEPTKETAAVGKPPISRWEYTDFTVYFEYEHVINTVLKAKKHESTQTVIEETVEMKEDDLKLKE